MNSLETFFAIVIICIDNDERGLDDLLRCQHSLTGSPRLCTSFRQSSRNVVDILESIVYRYIVRGTNGGNAVSDDLFEFFLDILADDKYYMVETSLNRIMDRLVHDDVVSIIDRFQLFYSCSKSAANSGGHDK